MKPDAIDKSPTLSFCRPWELVAAEVNNGPSNETGILERLDRQTRVTLSSVLEVAGTVERMIERVERIDHAVSHPCSERKSADVGDAAGLGALAAKVGEFSTSIIQPLNVLNSSVLSIGERIANCEQAIARADATVQKRSVLDDEMRRLQTAEFQNEVLSPIFLTVIQILDRIREEQRRAQSLDRDGRYRLDAYSRQVVQWTIDVRKADIDEYHQVLARFSVEPFLSKPGDSFDPARHKVIDIQPTDDPGLHDRIAQNRRYGYVRTTDNWIVRREFVDVYKLVSNGRKDTQKCITD